MNAGLLLADHGPANGQEKRPGFAESMAATFDGKGYMLDSFASEVPAGPFRS
jgi:hypothetical protein